MLSNVSKLESAGSSINYSAQLSAAPELPNVKPTFQKDNNVFSGRFIAKLYRRRAKKREKKTLLLFHNTEYQEHMLSYLL